MEITHRRVGNYELLTKLNQGGMGEVFLARLKGAHGFSRLVAVKVILPEVARTAEARTAFFDEAQLAARLAHPGIAQVFDFGEDQGALYLSMEYVAGVSFSWLFRRQPALVPPAQVARLMGHVCRALHSAHEARDEAGRALQVVHRDISPQNLLLSFNGVVKVIDFGIAKMLERRTADTHEGLLKGKPSYISPEQIQQGIADRRSDLWSCAVVAHELLTGQRLFRGPTDWAELNAVIAQKLEPPSRIVGRLPAGLDEAIMRGLEREPEARWSSALELAEAFEQIAAREHCPLTEVFAQTALADERRAHDVRLASIAETATPGPMPRPPPLEVETRLARPVRAVAPVPTRKVKRESSWRLWLAVGLLGLALGAGSWWASSATPVQLASPTEQPVRVVAPPSLPLKAVEPGVAPPNVPAVEEVAVAEPPRPQPRAVNPREKLNKTPVTPPVQGPVIGNGTLTVGAIPFALVRIDGVPLGATPLVERRLPAGMHLIEWLAPDTNAVRERRTVNLIAGQFSTEFARSP